MEVVPSAYPVGCRHLVVIWTAVSCGGTDCWSSH